MTIPTRPAPAPPGASAQTAVAGANATLEQIRLQLQQQQQLHQQQQQNNSIQRITIKLPPPPKGSAPSHSTSLSTSTSSSSITRKFPQARYSPATNWDDSPFDAFGATTNGNATKKVPPPRPPPPKVQANGRKATTAPPPPTTRPHQHNSIITNLFQRKSKQTKAPTPNNTNSSAARVYGVSSGNYGSTNSINSSSSYKTTATSSTTTRNGNANVDWNAAWNTTTTTTATTLLQTRAATPSTAAAPSNGEPQLISFDSPPSSPTFTQKSNSDCLSVDSFSSDSNFSSPNNGSVSQPESGFEDDFSGNGLGGVRSRPATTSPLDPWETVEAFDAYSKTTSITTTIGTAPVRNIPAYALRTQQTNFNVNNNHNTAQADNPLCNGKSLLPPAPSLAMPTIIKPKISQKPKAPKPPVLHPKPHLNGGNIYGTDLPTPPSPPMPMCAPPPPPPAVGTATNSSAGVGISLLDVISGKVDALQLSAGSTGYMEEVEKPYGIALYDFDGVEEGDLSFRENEKIYLIEQLSAEWYRGRTRSGCEGIFPVNYVDIKVPLSAANGTSTVNATSSSAQATYYTHQQTTQTYSSTPAMPAVRCLYDFPADVPGDLALRENDFVTIHYRINEDWLYGEIHGRQGQFPANFLEYLPDNIPYMPQ